MYKTLIVMALTVLTMSACHENKTNEKTKEVITESPFKANSDNSKPFINPPITDLTPLYVTFTLDASKGTTFRLKNGSEIVVPKGALSDKNGKILTGSVKLKYREMHDAISIYLAGIPMHYKEGNFTTAGSFELRGVDENVQLVKPVKVKMASYTEGSDYDFFYLNEKKGAWDSLGRRKPEINKEKKRLLQNIDNQQVALKFPLNRDYFAFNYLSILDVYFEQDFGSYKLKDNPKADTAISSIASKLEAYGIGWERSFCENRTMIEWEGGSYPASLFVWKNIHKTPFPSDFDEIWGVFKPLGGNRFNYHVVNEEDAKDPKAFDVELEAVMPLKSLFAFSPEQWKKDYEKTMAKVRAEQVRVKQMANIYRTFEVNNFGLYNWDKLMKDENAVILAANFDFPSEINPKLTELNVVYISGDNKGIITFTKASWDKMALLPDKKGRLFTILPNNKVALFNHTQYSHLDFEKWRKEKTPQYLFDMKTQNDVQTEADLRRILQI
jgi:hypothetical protein